MSETVEPKPPVMHALAVASAMFAAFFVNDAIGQFNNLSLQEEVPAWTGFVQPVLFFSGLFILIRLHGERNLGGLSTYGKALGACTIAVFFLACYEGVYQYVFYNLKPEAMDTYVNASLEKLRVWIDDEDKLEEIADKMNEQKSSLIYGLNALLRYFLGGFIVSLIVSAFQRYIVRNYRQPDIFSK